MRFPKMHIAQSVTNRIMNIANKVQPATGQATMPPAVPQPQAMGKAIDQALAQPPGAMAAPPGAEGIVTAAALEGSSPAEALAIQGVENDQA